jgi:hypothetical protein
MGVRYKRMILLLNSWKSYLIDKCGLSPPLNLYVRQKGKAVKDTQLGRDLTCCSRYIYQGIVSIFMFTCSLTVLIMKCKSP